MLSTLLAGLLLGLFCSLVFLTLTVGDVLSQRRRASAVLAAQVGGQRLDLRQVRLQASVLERLVKPAMESLTGLARRFTPKGVAAKMERKLELAGEPEGWDVYNLLVAKAGALFVGVLGGVGLTYLAGLSGGTAIAVTVIVPLVAFHIPDNMLAKRAQFRQRSIQKSLPDVIDLLTISVEAGLSFDAALSQVVRNVPGVLSEEVGRTLQEMQLGVPRVEAFKGLADRTKVDDLRAFVLALTQAEVFGVSVSHILRSQTDELRKRRRQRAEEQAQKIPVKMLPPLIFCIMPALFVVLIGPTIIRIIESGF